MKRDILLSILSGLLLNLSFPIFNLWLLAWFAFVPLFFAIQGKSRAKAFLLAYLTGIVFWFGIIYWLIHVTLPGLILFVLYLALYFGIFGLILKNYELRIRNYELLFIPALWVLLEYIRSHLFTGFPWALLGYAQHPNLAVIQIADITGVWGVSFLVMMVNVALYRVRSKGKKAWLAILLLLLSLSYGFYKLYLPLSAVSPSPVKISVIQPNIPQELKWDPGANNYIMQKYLDISLKAQRDNPDLIIWPEAALPVVLEAAPSYYEEVRGFVREIKTPLLLGAVTYRDNLYYNSALLLSGQGELLSRYDKLHLVPFGEYVPLKPIWGFLETIVPIGDFTKGNEYTVFNLPVTGYRLPITFSALICFEDLFPEISRDFVRSGAGFLVNITNDAWFKKTSSPYQHLAASVFRAIENGVFVVRAANTGVSGFIAPTGEILSLVGDKSGQNIFIPGYKTGRVFLSWHKPTLYNRYGDSFIIFCVLLILGGIAVFKKKR